MQNHKIVSNSLTVPDRIIPLKSWPILNFQKKKFFLPKMAPIFNFELFGKNAQPQNNHANSFN